MVGSEDDATALAMARVGPVREFNIAAFLESDHGRIPKKPSGPNPVATFSPAKCTIVSIDGMTVESIATSSSSPDAFGFH
eukprot:5050586-Ditylum_brightwellii.AAC.1